MIFLRPVKLSDISMEYVKWMNSKQVNQFLESRFSKHTLTDLKNYQRKISKDPNTFFMGIFKKEKQNHIGNIKLGPIDWNHKIADIGIMIGDKNSWGKGYATDAIKLITNFGFKKLKLHKLTAGAYENNLGSIKAFLKAGFHEEARRRKHFFFKGKFLDGILLAKINQKK